MKVVWAALASSKRAKGRFLERRLPANWRASVIWDEKMVRKK